MHIVNKHALSLKCNLKELRYALIQGKSKTLRDLSASFLFVLHKCHASLYTVMKSCIA